MEEKTEGSKIGDVKTEEKEKIMPRVILVRKLFILNTILLVIFYLLPYMVPYVYPEIPRTKFLMVSTIMGFVVTIFYGIILISISRAVKKINNPVDLLADKMMKCQLRIENGLDYCARCKDSYTCASGTESRKEN